MRQPLTFLINKSLFQNSFYFFDFRNGYFTLDFNDAYFFNCHDLIQNHSAGFIIGLDLYPGGIASESAVTGAMVMVLRNLFISSGEITTHSPVFFASFPAGPSRFTSMI